MRRFLALLLLALLAAGCAGRPTVAPGLDTTLTIEDYPVADRKVDQPGHFEFRDRIPADVLAKRAETRKFRMGPDPEVLARLGYRLVAAEGGYQLYRGDQLVRADLSDLSAVSVRADGTDFAFVSQFPPLLIRTGGLSEWSPPAHFFQAPVFAGNDLVEVKADPRNAEVYIVLQNGREVYRGNMGRWAVDRPLKRLGAVGDDWVLEVAGDLIVSGRSQKRALGYNEFFGWQLLDGKPFYFFRQGTKIGVSYDGKVQAAQYDEVVHNMCCEPAAFNPVGNGKLVWFYARKGEIWHYVEAGRF